MKKAKKKRIFKGIKIGKDEVEVTHLQYTNNVIFFNEWSKISARNLLGILKCFELVLGMKVNFNNNKITIVEVHQKEVETMAI